MFINELAEKFYTDLGYPIVFIRISGKNRVSIRHYVDGVDIGQVLDDLGIGGGHDKAAGFFVESDDEIHEKIYAIIDVIKNIPAFIPVYDEDSKSDV